MAEQSLEILYQDEHYIAVHKPAGLLVHRSPVDAAERRFCLQLLRDQIGRAVYPCHRLDKPTSGVLLFALDKDSLRLASRLFGEKAARKTYRGIVRGWVEGEGVIDHPLLYQPEGGVTRGAGAPQDAVSHYRCLRQFAVAQPVGRFTTARYAELELVPKTGRMHQLRRHMKHLHHPIVGDTRYGDGVHNRFFREHLHSHRLLLMAVSLEFRHPLTGTGICINRGADPDYDAVVKNLSLQA